MVEDFCDYYREKIMFLLFTAIIKSWQLRNNNIIHGIGKSAYFHLHLCIVVYYISNEYNRNAGLTVDRCGLLISIPSLAWPVFRY